MPVLFVNLTFLLAYALFLYSFLSFFVIKLPYIPMNLIYHIFRLPLFSEQLSWHGEVTDFLAVHQLDLSDSWAWLFSPKIVNLSVIFLWSFTHTQSHTLTQNVQADTQTHKQASPLGFFRSTLFERCVMYPGTLARSPGHQANQDSPTGHLTHSHTHTHTHWFTQLQSTRIH